MSNQLEFPVVPRELFADFIDNIVRLSIQLMALPGYRETDGLLAATGVTAGGKGQPEYLDTFRLLRGNVQVPNPRLRLR